ncbi:MAG: hypothetical protein CVU46_03905 [Chloroflexi bacterium HGW-Chloroflexi-8]|nr:MAG: hypothetical protein CVU46_03905 [Chloroflexi bacterium HGW-Chloroflexi-8]
MSNFSIFIWVLSIFSLVKMIFGLFQNKSISRTAQILALPMGIRYEIFSWLVLLAENGSEISWVCYIKAYFHERLTRISY